MPTTKHLRETVHAGGLPHVTTAVAPIAETELAAANDTEDLLDAWPMPEQPTPNLVGLAEFVPSTARGVDELDIKVRMYPSFTRLKADE